MNRIETDLVIVGCGAAGLSCALTALENGSKVVNIERSVREDMGGNTRWTEANLLLKTGEDVTEFEVADEFLMLYSMRTGFHVDPDILAETVNDYSTWSAHAKTTPFLDPELLGAFIDAVPETLNWATGHGVKIDTTTNYIPYCIDTAPYAKIYGGGLALVEALTPAIEERGGEILFETTARELIEENGTVVGVRCTKKNNETIEIYGKVVLASGGFEGNQQMLVQYGGAQNRYLRPVAKGGHYNKGEGLRMALELNAATAGDWTDSHQQVIDPRSGMPEAMPNIWPFGIMVNQKGQRFIDEAPSDMFEWQEEPAVNITKQPGGIAYIIYDQQLADDPNNWRYGIRTEKEPYKADTLEELAMQIGIHPQALLNTVDEYNKGCSNTDKVSRTIQGVDDFGLPVMDGAGTEGVTPPKSNFASTISEGPFYCYPAVSSICFTMGGLRVNSDAQVVNASGEAIPGLYAAGETVGISYGMYTVGTSVLRGLAFGRIAGKHASGS